MILLYVRVSMDLADLTLYGGGFLVIGFFLGRLLTRRK